MCVCVWYVISILLVTLDMSAIKFSKIFNFGKLNK